MYRKQVRRRRAILVLLVVGCLMLISISISEAESGPLNSVQNGLSSVFAPIGEGASRALKPARDLVNWFDETLDARGDNNRLKGQVADLRAELVDTKAAAEKAGYAEKLKKLTDDDDLATYAAVDGSVNLHSFSAWYGAVGIDVGSDDGVSRNDAVVTADGLIGRVSEVSGGSAKVALITDGSSAVTARVSGGGPIGSVEAVIGAPGELDFALIQGDGEVKDGDDLVTAGFSSSGLASLFPGGIPIGKAIETIPAQERQQQQIRIEPFANLDELNEVTVLTGGPQA